MLSRLESMAESAALVITLIGLAGLVLISFAVVVDVTARWIFNAPLKGLLDIVTVLLPISIGAAIPSVVITRGNISIRFLQQLLGSKVGHLTDAVSGILGFCMLSCIAWAFFDFGFDQIRDSQKTWTIDLPTGPFWLAFAALVAISAVFTILTIIRDIVDFFHTGNSDDESDSLQRVIVE